MELNLCLYQNKDFFLNAFASIRDIAIQLSGYIGLYLAV